MHCRFWESSRMMAKQLDLNIKTILMKELYGELKGKKWTNRVLNQQLRLYWDEPKHIIGIERYIQSWAWWKWTDNLLNYARLSIHISRFFLYGKLNRWEDADSLFHSYVRFLHRLDLENWMQLWQPICFCSTSFPFLFCHPVDSDIVGSRAMAILDHDNTLTEWSRKRSLSILFVFTREESEIGCFPGGRQFQILLAFLVEWKTYEHLLCGQTNISRFVHVCRWNSFFWNQDTW